RRAAAGSRRRGCQRPRRGRGSSRARSGDARGRRLRHPDRRTRTVSQTIGATLALADRELLRTQAYVDGAWVDADSGETFDVLNPATGELIAEVPRCGVPETRRAIEAAEAAQPAWRAKTAKQRAQVM